MKAAQLQVHQGIRPVGPSNRTGTHKQTDVQSSRPDFGRLLEQNLSTQELKFSGHAIEQMQSRNLQLSVMDMQRLQQGLHRLRAKGAGQSVILLDNKAFVVSVRNRTVITALDHRHSTEKVFTQIDSLAIV